MANCTTISSVMKACDGNNIGGIYEVYIADQVDVSATTVNLTAHTITGITMSATGKYATFQFNRNVGNYSVEPTIDLINGSSIYTATITLQFNRREATKSRALQVLGEGQRFLSIIVKNADGTYTYFDYAQISGGPEESGTNKTDGSKYTVTFVAQLEQRPYFVNSALITSTIITTS